jgi:hypothetical protein
VCLLCFSVFLFFIPPVFSFLSLAWPFSGFL